MTKKRKRRFEEDHQELNHSGESKGCDGVGQLLTNLKTPFRHHGCPSVRENSGLASPDAFPWGEDTQPDHSQGWQMAGDKHNAKSKRKRAGDGKERIKYPELTYHSRVNTPIRIADLQALTLYTIGDGAAPSWIAFKHAHHTRKVVVLMVPGLEKGMFDGSIPIESETVTLPEPISAGSQGGAMNNVHVTESDVTAIDSKDSNPTRLITDYFPKPLQPLVGIFDDMWSVKAPGDSKYLKIHSPIQAMLFSPIPRPREHKSIKGPRPPAEEREWQSLRTPITNFVHSTDELRDADYPLHPAGFDDDAEAASVEQERRDKTGQNAAGGWVDTIVHTGKDSMPPNAMTEGGSITAGCTVFAVDCEMVLTTDDRSSLARISIVDWSGKTTLDELVKPDLPIKNYFTQFSGMTSAILDPVKTTLSEVQAKLLDLFTPQTILLGHSLESDLAAMKLTHPFIVDTSLIYPHPRGPPLRLSLKHLTQRYLGRDIQQHDSKGHDSVEDALAVLDLAKLKCEKGPRWGTSEATGEPIFRRLGRQQRKDGGGIARSVTSAMVDYGTPGRGYGKEATAQVGCQNDEEIVRGISQAVNGDSDGKLVPGGGVEFVWGRLRELESARGWCNNNREYGTVDKLHDMQQAPTPSHYSEASGPERRSPKQLAAQNKHLSSAQQASATDSQRREILGQKACSSPGESAGLHLKVSSTASHIRAIYDSLPPCTLFIVYTGTGDPRELGRLQAMQQRFRKEFKTKKWDDLSVKWTDDEEQALKKAVEKAREGIGFMCVK